MIFDKQLLFMPFSSTGFLWLRHCEKRADSGRKTERRRVCGQKAKTQEPKATFTLAFLIFALTVGAGYLPRSEHTALSGTKQRYQSTNNTCNSSPSCTDWMHAAGEPKR